MKKTKELESEETSVSMDKILKIESLEDAKEFERVAIILFCFYVN